MWPTSLAAYAEPHVRVCPGAPTLARVPDGGRASTPDGPCAPPAGSQQHGINLLDDDLALARLAEAAEAIKLELSTKVSSSLNLPFITADGSGPKHLRADWTRSRCVRGRPGAPWQGGARTD